MKPKKVNFSNQAGVTLEGILESPIDNTPIAYAIFAHCFTCTKSIKAANVICRALATKEIATLRFDFTGLGMSGGDFADSTFSSDIQDIASAAKFLEDEFTAPQILVGHSLGGAAVLHAAGEIISIKAVATIGSPYDPEHVTHILNDHKDEILLNGEAQVKLAGREFTIKKSFFEDLQNRQPEKVIANLNKALLVLHSPIDQTVGIDNAANIYTAAKHPKSFISLDNADHLLMKNEDSAYAANIIATWAQRYVGLNEPSKS